MALYTLYTKGQCNSSDIFQPCLQTDCHFIKFLYLLSTVCFGPVSLPVFLYLPIWGTLLKSCPVDQGWVVGPVHALIHPVACHTSGISSRQSPWKGAKKDVGGRVKAGRQIEDVNGERESGEHQEYKKRRETWRNGWREFQEADSLWQKRSGGKSQFLQSHFTTFLHLTLISSDNISVPLSS